MKELKDSGVPWIGEIPKGWQVIPLKGLGRFYGGLTGKAGDDFVVNDNDYFELFVPFTNIFNNNVVQLDKLYKVKITVGEKQTLVHKGDILFLMSSEDYEGLGKPALMNDEVEKLHLNSFCKGFTPNSDVVPSFLNYYLQGQSIREYIRSNGNGFIRINLKVSKLGTTPVLLPSLPEQQRIAGFLDSNCADIDAIMEKTRASIEEYKKLKQSVITEAVTNGIRGERPMKDSGEEWIGEIPADWALSKTKYHIIISNGSDPLSEGEIPVYGSGADSFKTCGEYKEGPTVLIGRKGATLHIPHYIEGKYWNVDTAFDTTAKNGFSIKYFYYLACSFDYKKFMSQTTLPSMTQSCYENMQIPVPPYSEQCEIAAYLDEKCAAIDSLIASKEALITELEAYKKSLIYEYVTGKKEL